ncbi:MAG: ATP-binding protein [Gemmatimonadaceae bacterium]
MMARLAQHRLLGSAPVTEHAWLVKNGKLRTYPVGGVVTAKSEQAKKLLIMFSGRLVLWVDRGAGSHKVFEWKAGEVAGVMPYSRVTSPPNDVVAEEPTELLAVQRELLPEMIRECPVITDMLVHVMVDRARTFTSSDLRDEKLISLGKLAAGLAHELNNPASAVVRSAKMLTESLGVSETAARRLEASRLSDAQLAAIDAVRSACNGAPASFALSAVARADREDAISDWLDEHGSDEECAAPLATTGVTLAALDALAASMNGDALDSALRWIAAGCNVRALAAEIETASSRIHDLVGTVKRFTFMDRAPAAEPVDIRQGIAETLTLLGSKARSKSVTVSLESADDLPRAQAVGAELNQVWMNLIDNAIDAVPVGGHVEVSATHDQAHVIVRIVDDGAGIPPDIQGRIFDPFFTTKGVGEGTGMGLDIVRRILQQQEGEIAVDSRPGRTEFQVRLPVEKVLS